MLKYLSSSHLYASEKLKLILKTAPAFTIAAFAVIFMTVADRWIIGAYLQESQVTYY